jgi:hypothetical protein
MVCRWMQQEAELREMHSVTPTRKRVDGGGRRAVLYEQGIEEEVYKWIIHERIHQRNTVTYRRILDYMRTHEVHLGACVIVPLSLSSEKVAIVYLLVSCLFRSTTSMFNLT